jgi:2',3'-cyclic-nucleotide 2'-phosphodiesterase (5'-nucleotidase family)
MRCFAGAGLSWLGQAIISVALSLSTHPAFASESEQIRILSTNDIHTYMRPVYHRYLDQPRPWGIQSTEGNYVEKAQYEGRVGGLANVSTVINQLRSEKPGQTLLVDSGDTWHGSGKLTLHRRLRELAAAHGVRACAVWGGANLNNEKNLYSAARTGKRGKKEATE